VEKEQRGRPHCEHPKAKVHVFGSELEAVAHAVRQFELALDLAEKKVQKAEAQLTRWARGRRALEAANDGLLTRPEMVQ
jgi:hypothetical protein